MIRTGTGKTLAFLIPSLEILLQAKNKYQNEGGIKPMILIISPTRELALQIASEADSLCSFYSPKILISTFVGGTSVPQDEKVSPINMITLFFVIYLVTKQ